MSRPLFALTLLAGGLALAAPETPPTPGPTPPFELPATTDFTLPDGLKVTLVPYGAVPKSNVSLAVRVGNVDEKAGQTGLADSMGKLLLQGTQTKSAVQVAEAAAKLGGPLAVNVREDETSLDIECLGDSTADAVRLIAEVARTPAFPASELARLKGDLQRDVAIQRSQPQPLAEESYARAIYGNHPYGRVLPVKAQIEKFTLEQARQLWAGHAGADQAHVYVVGRFDAAAVRASIEQAFGGWKKAKAAPRPKPAPRGGKRVFLVDCPGAIQSTVRIGLPVVPPTSPDYIPLVVTNAMLGGSFGSRITANIREKHGYTYSPFSALATHPGAGDLDPVGRHHDQGHRGGAARGGQRGGADAHRASRERRADRHPEVRGGHVRAPQQQPCRHRRPAPVRGPVRPARRLAPDLRPAGGGADARGHHPHGEEVPRPGEDDAGGGGRPEGGRGVAEAVRAGEARDAAVASGQRPLSSADASTSAQIRSTSSRAWCLSLAETSTHGASGRWVRSSISPTADW